MSSTASIPLTLYAASPPTFYQLNGLNCPSTDFEEVVIAIIAIQKAHSIHPIKRSNKHLIDKAIYSYSRLQHHVHN